MKIQNAYGTTNNREKELAKVNREMSKHFEDTFDCQDVLLNQKPAKLLIIKDADGAAYKKKIKSQYHDLFKLGDYVIWNNQVWLVNMLDTDSKTWESGYMQLCTILLRFQDAIGNIIERWACINDFANSNGGISESDKMSIPDSKYNLWLPVDTDTKHLKREQRFAISIDEYKDPDIYKLTGIDFKSKDYSYFNKGHIMGLTLSYDLLNKDTDKYIELPNKNFVWICDYFEPLDNKETEDSSQSPSSSFYQFKYIGNPTIRCGGSSKIFSIIPKDILSDDINITWKIRNLIDGIKVINEQNNSIEIKIEENEKLLGTVFTIVAYLDNTIVAELDVKIID